MTIRPARLHLPACAALLSAVALAHDGHDDRPYPTAGADGPVATLRYDVRDAGGAPPPSGSWTPCPRLR